MRPVLAKQSSVAASMDASSSGTRLEPPFSTLAPLHRPLNRDWGQGLTPYQLALTGVTHEQYTERHEERTVARQQLCAAVADARVPPQDKHHLRCQYTKKYGKTLFSCPSCWMLPTLCICGKVHRFSTSTTVIVQVHHDEWYAAEALHHMPVVVD